MPQSRFDAFCRDAFDLLERAGARHIVIGGLAVVAVGEPRTTGDVDVVAFLGPSQVEALIEEARRSDFKVDPELERERVRRTGTLRLRKSPFQLDVILASLPFDVPYLRSTLQRICDAAEDMAAWNRLERVLEAGKRDA